jgi:uncharacterized membrane protein
LYTARGPIQLSTFFRDNKPGSDILKTKDGMSCAAMAGILAVGTLGAVSAHAVPDQPQAWEKSAGISKAGMNDCGAINDKHGCAGQATEDNPSNEWVYVPKGNCKK